MADRIMYTKPRCPYCSEARAALEGEGVDFEERDATVRREWRDELYRYSSSGKVPTIVGPEGVTVGWHGGG